MANEKTKALYNQLVKDGYDLGDYNTFSSKLAQPDKAKVFHEAIVKDGYDVGDFKTFFAKVGQISGVLQPEQPNFMFEGVPEVPTAQNTKPLSNEQTQKVLYGNMPGTTKIGDVELLPVGGNYQNTQDKVKPDTEWTQEVNVPGNSVYNKTPEVFIPATKPEPEKHGYLLDVVQRVNAGASNMFGGFAKYVEMLYNNMADAFDVPLIGSDFKLGAKVWKGIGDFFLKDAEKSKSYSNRYNGKSFIDLWKEGKYIDSVGEVFLTASESIPQSVGIVALTMAGQPHLAAASMYAPSAGLQYDQLKSNDNMTDIQRQINAHLTGIVEAASEYFGDIPVGKWLNGIIKTQGKEAAKTIVKNGFKQSAQAIMKKSGLLFPMVAEGLEEISSQLGSNVVDYATGAKDKLSITDGLLESFVYGAAGGSQFSMVGGAAQAYNNIKAKKEFKDADNSLTATLSSMGMDRETVEYLKKQFIGLAPEMRNEAVNTILQNTQVTPEQVEKISNYFTTMDRYASTNEKFGKQVQHERNLTKAELEAETEITKYINPDTNSLLTLSVNGKPQQVVKGKIVYKEDKTIDREKSDQQFTYIDDNGETQITSIEFVDEVVEDIPAPEAVQAGKQAATAPIQAQFENEQVRPYEQGEDVRVKVGENQFVIGTIVGFQDGYYLIDDGSGQQPAKIEPRQIVNEDNIQGLYGGEEVIANVNGHEIKGTISFDPTLRVQGLVFVNSQPVPVESIKKIEETPQNESITPSEDSKLSNNLKNQTNGQVQTKENGTEEQVSQPTASNPVYPVNKKGEPDFENFTDEQLFSYNKEKFGEETAINDLKDEIKAVETEIEKNDKAISKASMKDRIKLRENATTLSERLNTLKSLLPSAPSVTESAPVVESTPEQPMEIVETKPDNVQNNKLSLTDIHNRLVGLIEKYNSMPSNHVNKKRSVLNEIQKKAQALGYSLDMSRDKLIGLKDGKPIKRIGIKEDKNVTEAHNALTDYSPEFQSFVNTLKDYQSLFGLDIPVNQEQAVRNIFEGKKTVAANTFLDYLESMFNEGILRYRQTSYSPELIISIEEYFNNILPKETAEESAILDAIPDEIYATLYGLDELSEEQLNYLNTYIHIGDEYQNIYENETITRTDEGSPQESINANENSETQGAEQQPGTKQVPEVNGLSQAERDTQELDSYIAEQAHNTNPTEKQKETGFYNKAEVKPEVKKETPELTEEQSPTKPKETVKEEKQTSPELELVTVSAELAAAKAKYDKAQAKYLDLKKKLENDPAFGMGGQKDIFGNVSGADNLFGNDGQKQAVEAVQAAKKIADDLKPAVEELQAKADKLREAVTNKILKQQEMKFEEKQDWRDIYYESDDFKKADILEALSDKKSNDQELLDIIDKAINLGINTERILYNISQNKSASRDVAEKATAELIYAQNKWLIEETNNKSKVEAYNVGVIVGKQLKEAGVSKNNKGNSEKSITNPANVFPYLDGLFAGYSGKEVNVLNSSEVFDTSTNSSDRLKAATEIIRELEKVLRVGTTPAILHKTTEEMLKAFKELVSDSDYQEALRFLESGQKISGVRVNEKVLINVEHNTKATDLIGTYMHETGHKAFDLVFLGENLDSIKIDGIESFIPDVYWGESNRTKISEAVAHQIEELLNVYTPQQIKNGDIDVSLLDERIIYPLTKTLNKLSNGKISIIGTWKVNDIGSTAGSSGGIQENRDSRNDSNAEIESNQPDNGISEREAKKRELAERLKNKLKPDYKRYEIPKNFKDNIGVRRDISGNVSIIENFPDAETTYQWEEKQLPEWTKEAIGLVDKVKAGKYLESEEIKNLGTTLFTAKKHAFDGWDFDNVEDVYAILVYEGYIKPVATYKKEEYIERYNNLRTQSKPQYKRSLPATIEIDGVERPTTNSTGKPIHSTEEGIRNFWKWFGDSKVVDESGRPLVVNHGSRDEFTTFDKQYSGKSNSLASVGFWFSDVKDFGKRFADNSWGGNSKVPVVYNTYLKLEKPFIYESSDYSKELDSIDKQIYELKKEKQKLENSIYIWDYNAIEAMQIAKTTGFKDKKIEDYYRNRSDESSKAIDNGFKLRELSDKINILQSEYYDKLYTDSYQKFKTDVYKIAGMTSKDANIGGLGMAIRNKDKVVEEYVNGLKEKGYDGLIIQNTSFDKNAAGGIDNNQYVVFDNTQIKSATGNNGGFDGNNPNINFKKFDPELNAIAMELSEMIFEDGDVSFESYSAQMLDYVGEQIRPLLKPYYEMARVTLEAPNMTSADEVHKFDITNFNHKQYVSNRSRNSQQDSPRTDEVPGNAEIIPINGSRSGQVGNGIPKGNSSKGGRGRGKSNSELQPSLFGEQGDIEVSETNKELSAKKPTTGDTDGRGNGIDSTEGHSDINGRPNESDSKSDVGVSETFKQRVARKLIEQQKAEPIPVKIMDIDNIRETLPFLLSEQQDDVLKAETRFFGEAHQNKKGAFGKGMLFTNGTGTGKTYTGLGIAKRFAKQGKGNILIVVPSEAKVLDWAKDGKNLGLEITPLKDTKDAGQGAVVTTYANFRANEALKDRDFDLVIYDESHRLMEEKTGKTSSTTNAHYAHSNVTEWQAFNRLQSVNPDYIKIQDLYEKYKHYSQNKDNPLAKEIQKDLDERLKDYNANVKPTLEARAKQAYKNTKVVFLSATPFKSHFNLRYANGSLFDWGNETTYASASRGMSRVDAESQFFLDNFGSAYEWKFHRLQTKQKSNAEAIAMQEVQFAEKLIANGVMSGRAIESDKDYSREFPLVTLDNAETFNRALNEIYTDEFKALKDAANNVFHDYNYTTKLFESLKASMCIPRIQDHLDLGRKVVIFHRRKQADVLPPFRSILDMARLEAQQLAYEVQNMDEGQKKDEINAKIDLIYQHINAFESKYGDLLKWEQTLDYSPAIDQLKRAFGEKVVFINGDTSKKDKPVNINKFNDDNSEVKIIVVQEEAGKEGISLHDTTGKHPRVLMSLSLPISSTTTLQIEGRVYRIGQESNVPFEYPLLGIDQEISDFGNKINKKLSTTENLAMGNQARDLLRSFAEGVLFNSGTEKPNLNQGIGGKEYDKKTQSELSEFRKAVLVYQSNQKVRGSRDSREGKDYYATPEPVGQKMVEILGLQAGESAMEPSAGHGAIAMWFPDKVNSTVIEPSYSLYTKLNARAGGGNRKMVNDIFENYNIINKYHGIAMNPPFGSGGKTAVDHLEKAFGHLYNNGRVVAIIPQGQADKRLDDFLERTPNAHLIASIKLPSSTFEQAGTSVNTRIVVIDRVDMPSERSIREAINHEDVQSLLSGKASTLRPKEEIQAEVEKRLNDYKNNLPRTQRIDLSYAENIDELFNEIEYLSVEPRQRSTEETTQADEAALAKGKFEQFEQKHGKTGDTMYMVSPTKFHEREVFNRLVSIAKENNGYYSSYSSKPQNIRTGFVFKTKEDADKFNLSANKELSKHEFKIIGEKGAANLDKAEEATTRLDNLRVAKEMEKGKTLNTELPTEITNINDLKKLLDKAQIKNIVDVSYKNGSHYWKINGKSYRVSDHTKPKGSFGAENYDTNNDFRSYNDLYNHLKQVEKLDLSDKTEKEKQYRKEAEKYVEKINADTYKSPLGLFSSIEAATNNMWRLGYNIELPVNVYTPQEIRLATGWEKGVDGLWRYEVPDGNFKNIKYSLSEIPNDGAKLSEIWDDDKLFTSYPQLKDITVKINNNTGYGGTYIKESNTIEINLLKSVGKEGQKSTLIHEIQHAIQEIEGFARGGNIQDIVEYAQQLFDKINYNKSKGFINLDRLIDKINKEIENSETALKIKSENEELYREFYGKRGVKDPKLLKDFKTALESNNTKDAYSIYKRLSGEVEARNASTRMNFTPEERRTKLLAETADVAPEDQIVIMEGLGVSNSTQDVDISFENANNLVNNVINLLSIKTPVHTVRSVSDLKAYFILYGNENSLSKLDAVIQSGVKFMGAYENGHIFIIHSETKTKEQTLKTLLHEVIHSNNSEIFTDAELEAIYDNNKEIIDLVNNGKYINYTKRNKADEAITAILVDIISIGGNPLDLINRIKGDLNTHIKKSYEKIGNSTNNPVSSLFRQSASEGQYTDTNASKTSENISGFNSKEQSENTKGNNRTSEGIQNDLLTDTSGGSEILRSGELYSDRGEAIRPTNVNQIAQAAGEVLTEKMRDELDKKIGIGTSKLNSFVWREAYQDQHLAVKEFLDVLRRNGQTITDYNDFYMRVTALGGMNDAQLQAYELRFNIPIMKVVNAMEKVVSYRDIENYMMLKHGLERNEFMRNREAVSMADKKIKVPSKEEKENDIDGSVMDEYRLAREQFIEVALKKLAEKDYSGLKVIEEEVGVSAEEFIKDFESRIETEEFWKLINAATENALKTQLKNGMISKATFDELTSRYKYYIPLRGFDQEIAEDKYDYTPDMGTHFVAPLIKANGRVTRPEMPFAFIFQMNQSAIVQSNKNNLKQSILRLAREDKSNIMKVSKAWYEKIGEDEDGKPIWEMRSPMYDADYVQYAKNIEDFEEQMKVLAEQGLATQKKGKLDIGLFVKPKQAKQHEVHVYENGVEYVVYINANPKVSRAINGDNVVDPGKAFETIANINRWMAANFTVRNPLFVISNLQRDLIYSTTTLGVKEGLKYQKQFAKNIPLASLSLARLLSGKANQSNKYDAYAIEFIMNGGKTGYSHIVEIKTIQKRIEKEIKKGKIDDTSWVFKAFETANTIAENTSRLAAYITSREVGRSVLESISNAKEVTVNFNRKGSGALGAAEMRSLYLFFNVAVQALQNMGRLIKNNPGRMAGLLASFVASGFLAPILAGLLGGDDAEEAYGNLTEWERQNNFCIWTGNGFAKFALPQELRVFHALGDNIYMYTKKRISGTELAVNTFVGLTDLLPVNPAGGVKNEGKVWKMAVNAVTPDAIKPLEQLALNVTFTGGSVYNEYANNADPGFQQAKKNKLGQPYAPAILVWASQKANEVTGGDNVVPGKVSPNPDIVNHLMRGYLGGLYTIAVKSVYTGYKIIEGKDLKMRDTPLSQFYTSKEDIKESNARLRKEYNDVKYEIQDTKRYISKYNQEVEKMAKEGKDVMTIADYQRKVVELRKDKYFAIESRVRLIDRMEKDMDEVLPEKLPEFQDRINNLKKQVIAIDKADEKDVLKVIESFGE